MRNLKEKYNGGFSLIELVLIIGVLVILNAISIPSFFCLLKLAKATSALAALREIKTECALKKAEGKPEIFTSINLDGYTIYTRGRSNSCAGSNGVIRVLPYDANELPTIYLTTASGSLTYKFKGKTGTNFFEFLGMICGDWFGVEILIPTESTLFGPDYLLSFRDPKKENTCYLRILFMLNFISTLKLKKFE